MSFCGTSQEPLGTNENTCLSAANSDIAFDGWHDPTGTSLDDFPSEFSFFEFPSSAKTVAADKRKTKKMDMKQGIRDTLPESVSFFGNIISLLVHYTRLMTILLPVEHLSIKVPRKMV